MARDKESLIALFIDFDNIAIGLKESGNQPFDVRKVLERLLEKGRIIYKRAYADWYLFSDAKQSLHEHAIEMIDIPMRRNIGKNSADIRMVVDALDLCYTKEHIDTFVIGSGDSDFTPLVSKLKENEKRVIGFGLAQSTSNLLANNCDEFIFYEDLVSLAVNRPSLPMGLSKRQHDAFTLVIDAVAALLRENKDVLWGSLIKDTIRRKRPSFTESQYGYNSFSNLLEDAAKHQLIGLIKDPKSGGTPVVTGFGLANDTAARSTSGAQAAAPAGKGPSLLVKQDSSRLLPLSNGDSDSAETKPARGSRGKSGTRRRTPSTRTRKPADKPAPEQAEASSAAPEQSAVTETPVKREPAAAKPKTSSAPEAPKEEKPKPKGKPIGKTTTRRRTTARRKPAATETTADTAAVETKPAVTKPAKAKPAKAAGSAKAKEAPAAAETAAPEVAKADTPAPEEAKPKPKSPRRPRTTKASTAAKASTTAKDDAPKPKAAKETAKPAPAKAEAAPKSAPAKPAKSEEKAEEPPKPKGQPLRTRTRRRRR